MSAKLQLAYNTNGLTGMHGTRAVELLAEIGYAGIGITLDADFLNPFDLQLDVELDQLKEVLTARRFRCVVETGARFLLDPAVKHEPTLVSPSAEARARRIDFLCRAIDIAALLRAECVSLWSGAIRAGTGGREAMDRLTDGLAAVLRHAAARKVVLGFEPEPGMFIDTTGGYRDLLDELALRHVDASLLKLTLDIGHLHCQGEVPIADYVRRWQDRLVNVHIEDMCTGVHEHLMFGEGEINFPPVIAALREIGYAGLVSVELTRHRHEGPEAARQAYDFLRPLVGA